ncbi:MAG: apolipoprotein N-acyltransferase [Streptosporangiaceae bacterium]
MAFWRGFAQPVHYAALISGALPVLAFPAPNLEFIAWFGLVPGLLLMHAAPTQRAAAVRGWWFGAGFLLAALYWLLPDLGPGLLLVVAVLGALWASVGAATWGLLRPPVSPWRAVAALLVVPSCWVAVDWVRSWQGFGGPWAVFGVSQWQHPAILALAAVGGVWLVSFALVAANTGILIILVARRIQVRLLGAAAALAAVAAGPVAFALTPAAPTVREFKVALVQPGVVHNPALRVDASQRLSAGLGSEHADLIVWGESSVGYDLDTHASLLRQLERLSAADGAQLLVNQDSFAPNGAKSKVAVLIGSNGIDGRYVKTRLVPFGEYIPFRQQLGWLAKISKAAPQNMIPGTGAHVMRVTPAGGRPLSIGVLICFESAFPDMARVDADHGAQLIIYQTSDSTWQASWEWALAQHAALGAVRAAETGRPVVQAALTGDSAAFDARGRLLAWAGGSFRGVAHVRLGLPPASARTLYDQLGDYVPWSAVGIAALAAVIALIRTGRAGRLRIRRRDRARIVWERSQHDRSGSAAGTS